MIPCLSDPDLTEGMIYLALRKKADELHRYGSCVRGFLGQSSSMQTNMDSLTQVTMIGRSWSWSEMLGPNWAGPLSGL